MKNKNILIFGAGGLLGNELLRKLLEKGANIYAVDKNIESLNQFNSNNNTFIYETDITKEKEIVALFNKCNEIDGVVNCAYPRNASYGKKFECVSYDDFCENININLGASFVIMREAFKKFQRDKRRLSFVNISSIYGVMAPDFKIYEGTEMTMPVEYAAIKSAIIHLNKYLANYANNSNFRVNSISPGGLIDNQPKAFIEKYNKKAYDKGMLEARDIVDSIVYLLSDESKYVNGQNIIIDDGFSL